MASQVLKSFAGRGKIEPSGTFSSDVLQASSPIGESNSSKSKLAKAKRALSSTDLARKPLLGEGL